MTNKSTYQNDCQAERDIRTALVYANGNGWWRNVAELTTELNKHTKECPVCNGSIYSQLFSGQVVKVAE